MSVVLFFLSLNQIAQVDSEGVDSQQVLQNHFEIAGVKRKFTFIGGGKMASALIDGFVSTGNDYGILKMKLKISEIHFFVGLRRLLLERIRIRNGGVLTNRARQFRTYGHLCKTIKVLRVGLLRPPKEIIRGGQKTHFFVPSNDVFLFEPCTVLKSLCDLWGVWERRRVSYQIKYNGKRENNVVVKCRQTSSWPRELHFWFGSIQSVREWVYWRTDGNVWFMTPFLWKVAE